MTPATPDDFTTLLQALIARAREARTIELGTLIGLIEDEAAALDAAIADGEAF